MNYYEPGTAPLEAEHTATLNQGVIRELRRSGFWASFLGWLTVLGLVGVICLSMMAPSMYSKPRSAAPKDQNSAMTGATDEEIAKNRAEKKARLDQIFSAQGEGSSPASIVGPVIGIIMFLAAVGMVIMLIWFGAATRKVLYHPTYKVLHRIAVVQRRLWICIGVFCLCSIIFTLILWLGIFSGVGTLIAR